MQQHGQGWHEPEDAPVPRGLDVSVTMKVYTHLGLDAHEGAHRVLGVVKCYGPCYFTFLELI